MSALLVLALACESAPPPPVTQGLVPASPSPAPAPAPAVGGTVYVPVYSSVYVGEGNQTFDLAVTVTVRNTDRSAPITVSSLAYHDPSGARVQAYVTEPVHLAPLASADAVVRRSDRRVGVGGSFLVEWSAGQEVSRPLVEAVMVGSGSQQGLSWVSRGVELEPPGAAR